MFTSKAEAAGYLAAAIDGEGAVKFGRGQKGNWHRRVLVTNTSLDMIEACAEAAALLGIPASVRGPYCRGGLPFWHFFVCGRTGFELVEALVPLRIGRKREALHGIVRSYRWAKRPSREVLEQAYVIDGKSIHELCLLFGASDGTIRHWLCEYDIPRRTRSEGLRLAYAKGLRSHSKASEEDE